MIWLANVSNRNGEWCMNASIWKTNTFYLSTYTIDIFSMNIRVFSLILLYFNYTLSKPNKMIFWNTCVHL